MGLRLSPKRFITVVTTVLAFYSLARVAVLFFEALAVVREGRAEDYELISLCQRGDARGSAKMRDACLRARADLASPVVFKAVVHAVSTAFKDFTDAVGSPFKLAVFALFLVSSVVLPIVPWARALFGTSADQAPFNGAHYISYAPAPHAHQPRSRLRTKVGRMLKMRRGPQIEEIGDDEEFGGQEDGGSKGGGFHAHFLDIDLAKSEARPASPVVAHSKWE